MFLLPHLESRRQFMRGLAAGAGAFALRDLQKHAHAFEQRDNHAQSRFSGLITRERQPLNLEYPIADLSEVKTPISQFFVRTHFPIPTLDRNEWTLSCTGHVQRALSFRYDDLRKLPATTVPATIECAATAGVFPSAESRRPPLGIGWSRYC